MDKDQHIIEEFTRGEYKEGFVTEVEQELIPKGLNEEIIRLISRRKEDSRNRSGASQVHCGQTNKPHRCGES